MLVLSPPQVLGLVLEKVEVVFGFTGAVASTALSYCLPAAIHLRLSPHPARALRRTWRSAASLTLALALALNLALTSALTLTLTLTLPGGARPSCSSACCWVSSASSTTPTTPSSRWARRRAAAAAAAAPHRRPTAQSSSVMRSG